MKLLTRCAVSEPNGVSIAQFSMLLLLICFVGCGTAKKQVTKNRSTKKPAAVNPVAEKPNTVQKVPDPAPQASKVNPADEFDKLITFIGDSVPVKKLWFSMNDNHNDSTGFKSPRFSKESFDDEGVVVVWDKDRGPPYPELSTRVELENYDWDESAHKGYLYWNESESFTKNVMCYKITLSGDDAGLRVSKTEETMLRREVLKDLPPIKDRPYGIKIIHYKPASNLKLFWENVLKSSSTAHETRP